MCFNCRRTRTAILSAIMMVVLWGAITHADYRQVGRPSIARKSVSTDWLLDRADRIVANGICERENCHA